MFPDESWKPIRFGVKRSKVKVTTYLSVFRERNIAAAAAYVSYAGFFLLSCTAAQAMLASPDFSCVNSSRSLAAERWIYHSVCFCTLVSAGFFE